MVSYITSTETGKKNTAVLVALRSSCPFTPVVGSLPPRLTELAPESIHPLTRQFELASLKLSLVAQVRFTPATNKDYQGQQANGTGSKAETSAHIQVPILGG